jgi:glucokinase
MAGITEIAEIWCHAPPEIIGERYGDRSAGRLPGHPGLAYVPELIELARNARPCNIGPVLDVETTAPVDMPKLVAWVTGSFDQRLGA